MELQWENNRSAPTKRPSSEIRLEGPDLMVVPHPLLLFLFPLHQGISDGWWMVKNYLQFHSLLLFCSAGCAAFAEDDEYTGKSSTVTVRDSCAGQHYVFISWPEWERWNREIGRTDERTDPMNSYHVIACRSNPVKQRRNFIIPSSAGWMGRRRRRSRLLWLKWTPMDKRGRIMMHVNRPLIKWWW